MALALVGVDEDVLKGALHAALRFAHGFEVFLHFGGLQIVHRPPGDPGIATAAQAMLSEQAFLWIGGGADIPFGIIAAEFSDMSFQVRDNFRTLPTRHHHSLPPIFLRALNILNE